MSKAMNSQGTDNNTYFEYTYSAKQQKEVEEIRRKYLPKGKMEELRELDKSAEKPGTIAAVIVGIIGVLLLGVGMCCTMVWKSSILVYAAGIILGIVGMLIAGVAYPLYKNITKRQREKIAGQVLELVEQLCA